MGSHAQVVSIGLLAYIFAAISVSGLASQPVLAQVTLSPPTAAPSSAVASSSQGQSAGGQSTKPNDLEQEKLGVEVAKLAEQRKATGLRYLRS